MIRVRSNPTLQNRNYTDYGRGLARTARAAVTVHSTSAYWHQRFVAPSLNDYDKTPRVPEEFHRLFALRGKWYGLLAPGEVTAAHAEPDPDTEAGAIMVGEEGSRTAAYGTSGADTSITVRFDFAPPLPRLSPDADVIIMGRRYAIARLEYTLRAGASAALTGYFHPYIDH